MSVWFYLASFGLSGIGNAIINVVLPILVLQRTGDPVAAGTVATAVAIPSLLFALIGGHLVDAIGHKPMSIISDLISATSVVGLILVDTTLELSLGWFIALGIFGAIGDIPGMAARQALAGDVAQTAGKDISWLAGLSQGLMGVSFLIGPALAGVMMTVFPISTVLIVTASCSFAAAVCTSLVRVHKSVATAEEYPGLSAWREILKFTPIKTLIVVAGLSQTIVAPFMVLVPAHFQSINAPEMFGYALSGFAIGTIASGGVVSAIGQKRLQVLWSASMTFMMVGFITASVLKVTPLVVVGFVILGIGQGLLQPVLMIVIVAQIPEHIRGRTFSIFSALNTIGAPIGLSVATFALQFFSIYQTAVCCGALWIFIGLWAIGNRKKLGEAEPSQEKSPMVVDT